eukprot:m.276843 g.276843  ORF g.276843 m.276843 type:complete len:254 (+) comp54861_c1_seq1:63-824(+)
MGFLDLFRRRAPAAQHPGGPVHSVDAVYLGSTMLSQTAQDVDIGDVESALQTIRKTQSAVRCKVALTISVYGIKSLRTQFSGMTQKAAFAINEGVSYQFVTNESIYRIVFCADIKEFFCYIAQSPDTGILLCQVYECKSKKESRVAAAATVDACQKLVQTIALLRSRASSAAAADSKQRIEIGGSDSSTSSLIDLINYEGYADADEKFRLEMLELAGYKAIPYQTPDPAGPRSPSERTMIRASDPNEYERTRM